MSSFLRRIFARTWLLMLLGAVPAPAELPSGPSPSMSIAVPPLATLAPLVAMPNVVTAGSPSWGCTVGNRFRVHVDSPEFDCKCGGSWQYNVFAYRERVCKTGSIFNYFDDVPNSLTVMDCNDRCIGIPPGITVPGLINQVDVFAPVLNNWLLGSDGEGSVAPWLGHGPPAIVGPVNLSAVIGQDFVCGPNVLGQIISLLKSLTYYCDRQVITQGCAEGKAWLAQLQGDPPNKPECPARFPNLILNSSNQAVVGHCQCNISCNFTATPGGSYACYSQTKEIAVRTNQSEFACAMSDADASRECQDAPNWLGWGCTYPAHWSQAYSTPGTQRCTWVP